MQHWHENCSTKISDENCGIQNAFLWFFLYDQPHAPHYQYHLWLKSLKVRQTTAFRSISNVRSDSINIASGSCRGKCESVCCFLLFNDVLLSDDMKISEYEIIPFCFSVYTAFTHRTLCWHAELCPQRMLCSSRTTIFLLFDFDGRGLAIRSTSPQREFALITMIGKEMSLFIMVKKSSKWMELHFFLLWPLSFSIRICERFEWVDHGWPRQYFWVNCFLRWVYTWEEFIVNLRLDSLEFERRGVDRLVFAFFVILFIRCRPRIKM